MRSDAILVDDPPAARHVESDPDDDYLGALALAAGAHVVVTGDVALLGLRLSSPGVLTPRSFLDALDA
jgi:predicted nucleic acid-binding protein